MSLPIPGSPKFTFDFTGSETVQTVLETAYGYAAAIMANYSEADLRALDPLDGLSRRVILELEKFYDAKIGAVLFKEPERDPNNPNEI